MRETRATAPEGLHVRFERATTYAHARFRRFDDGYCRNSTSRLACWRNPTLDSWCVNVSSSDATKTIDDLDRTIIELLQADGRRPVTDMARELGVSATTVQRRIDRLIEDGVIRIIALAQASLVGYPVHVVFGITAQLDRIAEIEEALAAEDEVVWAAWTTGSFDVIAEAFFRSNDHLRGFIQQRLAKIPGIIRVENTTVLSLGKNVHKLDTVVRINGRQ